jgi:lipoprotein-anchoring transpeptidase ErfK/SrfK
VENVYMTEFVGFDPDRHNGFHSPIRDASGALLPSQNATTLGCVRLEEQAAKQLYAFAFIGMRVEIHN